jgi:hypothetical protein
MSMATTPATPNRPIPATTPPTMPTTGSKSQDRLNEGQPEESQPIRLGPLGIRLGRSPRHTSQRRPLVNASSVPPSSRFPLLSQCHDIGIADTRALLSEIVAFEKEQDNTRKNKDEAFSISLRNHKTNKLVNLVQIPRSKNFQRFKKNEARTKWLDKALDYSLETNGTDQSGKEEAAGHMMQVLAKKYPAAYDKTSDSLGHNGKRMDAFSTHAMWNEANIGIRARRVIKRFTRAFFDESLFATEGDERKLTESMPDVIRDEAVVDGVPIKYFLVPLERVITSLLTETWKDVPFKVLEVIIGGDHGQTKFGEMAKFVIRGEHNEVIDKQSYQVGFVDCKKDTYDIFQGTIGPKLNESIGNIAKKWVDISDESLSIEFVDPPTNHSGEIPNNFRPIKVFSTGDLKYLSMTLGKVNMDSKWCPFCKLSPHEWKVRGHEPGAPWTLEAMEEVRRKIASGELKDTPNNRRGCVDKPAFDSIAIECIVVPALHMMMGMGNDAFKHFLQYIDERHEWIGEEELEARQKLWEAAAELDVELSLYISRKEESEYQIFLMQMELAKIEAQKKERLVGSNKFKHSLADRREMNKDILAFKNDISELKEEAKPEKKRLKYLAARKRKLQKELNQIRAEDRNTKDSHMRQLIDDCLKSFGVDRGACHGGDFTGVALLILNKKIKDIFEAIKAILLSNPDSKVPPSEIEEQLNKRIQLFVIMDDIFSFARKPREELSDDIFAEYAEKIETFMLLWENMGLSMTTVKRHCVAAHLIEQMRRHGDLCEYFEDFVELMHQNQKKKTKRGKIRDFSKLAAYYNSQEYLGINKKVQDAGKAMLEKTKRIFKKDRGPRREELERERRIQTREEMYEETRAEAGEKLSSGLELNVLEHIANGAASSASSADSVFGSDQGLSSVRSAADSVASPGSPEDSVATGESLPDSNESSSDSSSESS